MKYVRLISTNEISLIDFHVKKATRASDVSPDDGRVDVWHRKAQTARRVHTHVNGSSSNKCKIFINVK